MDIVIAEIEPVTVSQLKHAVLNLGHQVVHTVSTGEAAFNISQKLKPDLVLVDLDLKGKLKGVDAGKKISDDLDIPVIFITVFTKNCLTMSLQLPEDAVTLSKPIKQDHLKYAISNIFKA